MRLALYAHYSSSGGVALYVLHYLRQLHELGFHICFVSNSPIPQAKEQELRELCEKIIERENTGYDFAMWQRALAEYDISQFEELLLTNSSIAGPFSPLGPLWQRAAAIECDFWGMTENDDGFGRHLQSYFLVFRRQAFEHSCFQTFWRSVLSFRDKQVIIGSYEIGLTRWLEEHGCEGRVLFPEKDLRELFLRRLPLLKRLRNGIRPVGMPQNAVYILPDLLLECGMPFLKLAVLREAGDVLTRANCALRRLKAYVPKDVLDELRNIAV